MSTGNKEGKFIPDYFWFADPNNQFNFHPLLSFRSDFMKSKHNQVINMSIQYVNQMKESK